ncbi:MAG: tRNA (guanosine(46)-N7)-methyltransferase TrmB [Planctomycetota bacterium]|jgi:tRNA (guanine-N7-)-methyltransferase
MSFGIARGRQLVVEGYGLDRTDLPSLGDDGRPAARVDPRDWFDPPPRPLEIEIGCGKGTFLVQEAGGRADTVFLGIERAAEFYRYAADRMRRRGLDNVRVLHADAVEFLRFWCADGVARVVHLYFSDPWPKKRHHKRRVVQDRSLADLHRVLAPGGELRLVTDHDDLWRWYETHAARHADLFERRPYAAPASAGEELTGTNYERKFAREGRDFRGMILARRDDAS